MRATLLSIWARGAACCWLLAGPIVTHAQVDCLGVNGGTALPGTPCDDENVATFDDIWYPNCYCQGQCEFIGGPCNDGNPMTVNDVLTACGCMGTCATVVGEPCDDGNQWTNSDMYWPACYCEGICDSPPGTLCDDGDPFTTGEFLNAFCQCVGGVNLISGNVYLDLDQDGVFNGADLPLPARRVDAGTTAYAVTNEQGEFFITVPSGSYALMVSPGVFETQAQAPPLVDVIGEGLISSGHSLALNATSLEPDLAVYTWQTPPRPGFMSWASISYRNNGTATTDGTLALTFDAQQTFVSSNGTLVGNTVSWDLTDIQPGDWAQRSVLLETPVSVPLGTVLSQSAQVTAIPPDAIPANDLRTVEPIVVGSFDPNDKAVWPATLTPQEVAAGRPVEYLIRFQNTGTFLAENVRITDLLPNGVDHASFEFLGSSHPCQTTFENGILEFSFAGIMLPDSNSNEPESHGFVLFQVKPRATLLPGDSVWNQAYIYFDFNEPVITNAATFSVELETAVDPFGRVTSSGVEMWPNPATDVLNIAFATSGTSARITIIDPSGRTVHSMGRVPVNGALAIPLAGLADGLYTLRVETSGAVYNQRFVKSR